MVAGRFSTAAIPNFSRDDGDDGGGGDDDDNGDSRRRSRSHSRSRGTARA